MVKMFILCEQLCLVIVFISPINRVNLLHTGNPRERHYLPWADNGQNKQKSSLKAANPGKACLF